ncbi:MAG TPA: hypothetical protein VM450_07685 [Thermomicrobiales bacterium]|nr:hypothetical protein [Thermomicrobiales bacterium]
MATTYEPATPEEIALVLEAFYAKGNIPTGFAVNRGWNPMVRRIAGATVDPEELAALKAARVIKGAEFDPLVPGPGEIITNEGDGPVAVPLAATNEGIALQNRGTTLPNTGRTLNVRGAASTVKDFSGITHFFVPALLDIRAYGAVNNADATAQGLSTVARRAANNAALQAAVNDSITVGTGSRRVYIPGGYGTGGVGDAYEFDATLTYDSGCTITTEHEEPLGARLVYYGAVNTHALAPKSQYRSYFTLAGVRLEDGRGSAAATGTGVGVNTNYVTNGTHIENCFVRGFWRNITTLQSDMVRITGGWIAQAHDCGIYLDQCGNFNYVRGLGMDIESTGYPTQRALIHVKGTLSGGGNTLEISDIKAEASLAGAAGIIFEGLVPHTHVNGVNVRHQNGVLIGDVIHITSGQANGTGEEIVLENVACSKGATNILRISDASGTPGEYTIPAHPTAESVLRSWSEGQRILNERIKPGKGAYSWTQAASGTDPGTVVPGAGAGTSPTITVDGDDQQGSITVTTGTTPSASNQLLSLYFRVLWPRDPRGVSLTPANATTAALSGAGAVYPGDLAAGRIGRKHLRLYTGATALAASTTYKWHYRVLV